MFANGSRGVRWVVTLGVATFTGMGVLASGATAQLSWNTSEWEIPDEGVRFEEYLGRDAMVIEGGTVWMRDAAFRDGVIEFDIAMAPEFGFDGLRFRAEDRANHEYVYLRPHLSGQPDAVQYTPIDNGLSSWQIYSTPRYVLPATFAADRWMHVRVAVQGRRMELSVDGQLLVFPHLERAPVAGAVGLTASGARFANFVIRPGVDPGFVGDDGAPAAEVEPGTVTAWRVSEPFSESLVDGVVELPRSLRMSQRWVTLSTAVRGIANLAQARVRSAEANTVFAAVTLRGTRATTIRVPFGFSDRVRVFLNGRQLFAAGDEYASRDYRFLGTMGLFDEIFLPLEAGDNELWLAVSEDFGGWGVTLQVPEGQGVEVVSPGAQPQNR